MEEIVTLLVVVVVGVMEQMVTVGIEMEKDNTLQKPMKDIATEEIKMLETKTVEIKMEIIKMVETKMVETKIQHVVQEHAVQELAVQEYVEVELVAQGLVEVDLVIQELMKIQVSKMLEKAILLAQAEFVQTQEFMILEMHIQQNQIHNI